MWKVIQKFVRNLVCNEDMKMICNKYKLNLTAIRFSIYQIVERYLNFNSIKLNKEETFKKKEEKKEKDYPSRFKLKSYKKEWYLGGNERKCI